jgi:hypothetical protein
MHLCASKNQSLRIQFQAKEDAEKKENVQRIFEARQDLRRVRIVLDILDLINQNRNFREERVVIWEPHDVLVVVAWPANV